MSERTFYVKLVLLAITGLLVAATLVLVYERRPMMGMRQEQDHVMQLYHAISRRYNGHPPTLANNLSDQAEFLSVAQIELDRWPFLFVAGCLGPCLLFIRRLWRKSH